MNVVHRGVYEEQDARVKAGLSVAEYDGLPGDPVWVSEDTPQISKAHVIAYARMSARITAVFLEAERRRSGSHA